MEQVRVDREMSIADRVRVWRGYRHLTRAECARRVGKPESWWRRVEVGQYAPLRWSEIILIGQALQVRDLDDLTGASAAAADWDRDREHPLLPPIRAALSPVNDPVFDQREQMDLTALLDRIDHANDLFHSSRYYVTDVGELLPSLLTDAARAHHLAPTDQRRVAAKLLTKVNVLGIDWCRALAAYELATLLADRAARVAREADDPVLFGLVAWQTAGLLKDQGKTEQAIDACQQGVRLLEPALAGGTEENLSVYGHLYLQTGLSAAHRGDKPEALAALERGAAIARRLGEQHVHPISRFGIAHVGVFGIRILTALGDTRGALRAADGTDVRAMPDAGARGRVLIDIARSYLASRDDTAALKVFEIAEHEAPEAVAHSIHVREGLRVMLRRDRRTISLDLHQMAERIGLAV